MAILAQQKNDPLVLLAVLLLVGGAFGISMAAPDATPWALAAIPVLGIVAYWIARWDVLIFTWVWVLSYGLVDSDALKFEVPGFFTMTPPRVIFIGTVLVYLLYFLRRGSVRFDRTLFWILLALVLYLGWNVHVAGWVSQVSGFSSAPYFRYLGAILLPFIMLWLVYNIVGEENQAAWPFVLVSILGWYVLYTGYLQFAYGEGMHWANSLIWPKYIVEANIPVDIERTRGPFRGAGPQATFLVALFYMNLFSIRRVRGGYRLAMWLQILLIPPAIFFTGVRAAYVAFLLGGVVWFLWAERRRGGRLKLAVAALLVAIGTFAFWGNLTGTDRRTGGVAQQGPIRARKILAAQAWEIVQTHPLTGVGFGHFLDHQALMAHDPESLAGMPHQRVVQHNVLLTMVSEAGIIGLVGLLAVFIAVFRESLSLYRKIPPTATGWLSREFVVVFWIIMLNYLVNGMFRDMLWEIPSGVLLWSMAGLVVGYNRLLEPHPINVMNGERVHP
ncbi:MAG: O-antigen ligase family protein [Phycisphaerae bacterium]|nr:O-antigen ligase family protein [Phycisphaerae bacterium]